MSIFGAIKDAIFGSSAEAAPPGGQTPASAAPSTPGTAAAPNFDVAAMLDKLEAGSSEDFDWRRSIVDLMKMLGIDSSLKARKDLAKELGYSGDMSDSATMNVWLHKQVMTKLAEHGGVVPKELKH